MRTDALFFTNHHITFRMNTKPWIKAVFSPTGGCCAIADAIVTEVCQTRHVDLTYPCVIQSVPEDMPLLAVVPVYGGRVPEPALERLAALKGLGGPAVAVVVYGNRAYEDALLELSDALSANGFSVVAAAAFIAEHSVVRSIASGRPDAVDKQVAVDFGRAVLSKLAQSQENWTKPEVPGNPEYRERPKMPVTPVTSDACGHCGSCASMCPVEAIPMDDPQTTDAEKCILCMRCVEICPQEARTLPAPMLEAMTARLMQVAAAPKQPEIYL